MAVIDSGIDYNHIDLDQNVWTNPAECPGGMGTCTENGIDEDGNGYTDDFYGWNFYGGNSAPNDPIDNFEQAWHGTHVGGTIGAVGNNDTGVVGVTWQIQVAALRVLPPVDIDTTFASRVIEALDYCIEKDIRVSNNSYGGGSMSVSECAAIQAAGDAIGHIFVAAAGNQGLDLDVDPFYPAACEVSNIITVAASDRIDELAVFKESTNCELVCDPITGECEWECDEIIHGSTNYGDEHVHLAAPGVSIYSAIGDDAYEVKQGTSMAAPHVAGAVALLWSRYPYWDYQQVRSRILDRVYVPSLPLETVSGGILDVYAALSDCNDNGVSDDTDISGGASTDCDGNGVPDECEKDCNANGVHDDCEPDCDGDGIIDECDTGCCTSEQCPSGEVCCNGSCRECCDSSDCPSGEVCCTGSCEALERCTDADCEPPQIHCRPWDNTCVRCYDDAHCPGGCCKANGTCGFFGCGTQGPEPG